MFRNVPFLFSLTGFYFDPIMLKEHSLCDFSSFKFVEICFIAQNMVYLMECSISTWKKSLLFSSILLFWMEVSIYFNWIQFVDVLCSSLFLMIFCFSGSRKGVLKSVALIMHSSIFLFTLYQILPHLFCSRFVNI